MLKKPYKDMSGRTRAPHAGLGGEKYKDYYMR